MSTDDCFNQGIDPEYIPNLGVVAQSIVQLGIDVLLWGETGTGKDTVAQRLHELSGRKGPLVAMNCAAIPEALAESELFGAVCGAYTGVDKARVGYIEAAQHGTLYLDEIDSMSLNLQAKLLRVLETRSLERLGSTATISVDICVIASAQRSLEEAVEQGDFRRDLYFRLNVLTVKLPALRERGEQIVPLFSRFANAYAAELHLPPPKLCPLLNKVLMGHDWPGNIRELKAAAKRYMLGFPVLGVDPFDEAPEACSLKAQLKVIERVLIQEALKRHCNCIDAVSAELQLPRRTLYRRMKALGI